MTNNSDNTVTVINVATNTVRDTITVGNYPYGISVSPDGSKVYVANEAGTISVINTATDTVSATIAVGANLTGICVSPDGKKVYVAHYYANTVSVINTTTNTVSATIAVGRLPEGIAVSPDGSKVYVANSGVYTVSVINGIADTVLTTIRVSSYPWGICASSDGSKVYVSCKDSKVNVINTAVDTVSATVAVGANPYGISVSPDGSMVYVANMNDTTVSVINTAADTVSATIKVAATPGGISVSPDGKKVYVANHHPGKVTVINTATNTVSVIIAAGRYPISFGNFISIYILPPTDSISASADTICAGTPTTLTASGASTYLWSDGLGTSATIVVSPTVTTTYTVTGTTTGGTGTASIVITVNASPSPVITAGSSICADSVKLDAGAGYSTYLWTTSATTETIYVRTTGTYTVTVSNASGCTGSASTLVTITPNPVPDITGPSSICSGSIATLDAGGGYSAYLWSTSATTETISVTTAGTYSVTVSDASGCTGSASITVTVNALPDIILTSTYATVCQGWCTTLNAVGGTTYLWSPSAGLSCTACSSPTACPDSTTTYTVTVTGTNGCTASNSVTVNIDIPNFTVSASPDTICLGNCSTLTASGGASYEWAFPPGGNTEQIVVCPATTTWYVVTPSDINGCTSSTGVTVYVSVCTGITENSIQQSLLVTPNPAVSNITIETPPQAIIEIINMQGQLIKSIAAIANKTDIDVSAFPVGMYMVKVIMGKETEVRKFVKE
ncbi:MAG: T9SS type A sorting domain-containing protein [Bacteroidales bacterium]|jgi:YVTN family beta-propeller protein